MKQFQTISLIYVRDVRTYASLTDRSGIVFNQTISFSSPHLFSGPYLFCRFLENVVLITRLHVLHVLNGLPAHRVGYALQISAANQCRCGITNGLET